VQVSSSPSACSAIVVSNQVVARGVRLLTLTPPAAWPFRPGQVAELSIEPGSEGYFAIASAPAEGLPIAFLVKAEGSTSESLMRVGTGAQVALRGPFGAGFSWPEGGYPPTERLLFVAAGTAVGAARSAIVELLAQGTPPARLGLLLGVRHLSDVCFADEIAAWHARGVDVRVCLSQRQLDPGAPFPLAPGRVQAYLAAHADPATRVFIAGSEALEDEVTLALVSLGVGLERIQRNYRPDARDAG
jgi:NAD(P)H-flavin reductase